MKIKFRPIAYTIIALLLVATFAGATIPGSLPFKITNATQTIFTVDEIGHVNTTGNIQLGGDLYVGGNYIGANTIGDEDVSDTLTASTWDSETSQGDLNVNDTDYLDGHDSTYFLDTTDEYIGGLSCADTEIAKWNDTSSEWECEADATGASTTEEIQDAAFAALNGTETHITVTYQDASQSVDFVVSDDFVLNTGDTITGDLDFGTASIILDNSTAYNISARDTGAYISFDNAGGITIHLEA